MIIRYASPRDTARLFAIWDAAVRQTHDFLAPRDFVAIAAMVRKEYLPRARLHIIEDAKGNAFGFLGLHHWHIDTLFVDPAYHRQGGGRALVEAVARDHPVLTVDVNEQNPGARLFYQRLGFVEIGRSARDHDGRPYPLLHLRRPRGG